MSRVLKNFHPRVRSKEILFHEDVHMCNLYSVSWLSSGPYGVGMLLFMFVSNCYVLSGLWDICSIVYAHYRLSYSAVCAAGPGPLVECDGDMLDW